MAAIPCDLTVQAYCNLPGHAYPWNAVRRFVHENQGLMKRMYGDTRHISVLKMEFEKNDIDLDDIQIATARYSPSGKHREERKGKFSGGHSGRLNDVLLEPHFRPTTTTSPQPAPTETSSSKGMDGAAEEAGTESTKKHDTETSTSTMSYTDEIENLKNKYEILLEDIPKPRDESVETNSIFENTTEGHKHMIYNQEKWAANRSSTEESTPKEQHQQISSTLKIVKVDGEFETTTTKKHNITTAAAALADAPANVEPIESNGDMLIIEGEGVSHFEEAKSTLLKTAAAAEKGTSTTKNYATLDRVDDFSAESSEIYTDTRPTKTTLNFIEDRPKTSSLSQTVAQQQPAQTMMEGHLYQDAVQKNNAQMPLGRGV